MVVSSFSVSCELVEVAVSLQLVVKQYSYNNLIDPAYNFRKYMRVLESGAAALAIWKLTNGSDWDNNGATDILGITVKGIRVACSVGTRVLLFAHHNLPAWNNPDIDNLIRSYATASVRIDMCIYGNDSRCSIRVVTFGFDLAHLQCACAYRNGKCDRTNRPHAIRLGPASAGSGSRVAMRVPSRLWRAFIEACVPAARGAVAPDATR